MAGKADATPDKSEPQKSSVLGLVLGFLLSTIVAGACGVGLVWFIKPDAGPTASTEHKHDHPGTGTPAGSASGVIVKTVPTILTNLGGERQSWIKLDLQALLLPDTPTPDALVATLSQDVLAYLRTVSHAQILGASGMQALREDLDQIAHVRSKGKSRGLLIRTLVIE